MRPCWFSSLFAFENGIRLKTCGQEFENSLQNFHIFTCLLASLQEFVPSAEKFHNFGSTSFVHFSCSKNLYVQIFLPVCCLIKTSSWRQLPLKIPRKKLIFLKRWVSFQCFVFSYRSVLHPALSFGIQKPSHVANICWKLQVFLPSSFQVIKVLHLTDAKTV